MEAPRREWMLQIAGAVLCLCSGIPIASAYSSNALMVIGEMTEHAGSTIGAVRRLSRLPMWMPWHSSHSPAPQSRW